MRSNIRKSEMTKDELKKACQEKGLKATRQRLEILNIVVSANDHPSVDAIYQQVKAKIPGISFDTVYRALGSFEEHKLITRVHPLDDKARYDPITKEHHHFICTSCKEIIDFEWPEFSNLKPPSFTASFGSVSQIYVEIRGLCRRCSK